MDWKKEAIRWRRAFWAAVDDDEFKKETKAAKKKKRAAKPKKAKKTGLNKPVAAGKVYKKMGVKFPYRKKSANKKRTTKQFDLF